MQGVLACIDAIPAKPCCPSERREMTRCGSRALLGEGGNLAALLALLMKREASGRCQPLG